MLKPPLLDTSLPPSQLAAWIDAHTMAVHHELLPCLDQGQVSPGRAASHTRQGPLSNGAERRSRPGQTAATSSLAHMRLSCKQPSKASRTGAVQAMSCATVPVLLL